MTTDTQAPQYFRIGGLSFVKPALGPVLVTLLLVGMCIGLGIWQVQRLQWKQGLIAELGQAQRESPVTMDHLPERLDDLAALNFHSVTLTGSYGHEGEFHVIGRSDAGEPGFHVLTPFRLAGDGRLLLVNRGWVPQNKKEPGQRPEDAKEEGDVALTGYILVPQGGSRFLPDHDVKDNLWFWQDTARMAEVSGLDLPGFVIQRVDAQQPAGTLPVAKKGFDVQLRNDHFAYALMWFSLAFAGLVIFAVYHRKPREVA